MLIPHCYVDDYSFSKDKSRKAFVATAILSSAKDSVLKFFFQKPEDDSSDLSTLHSTTDGNSNQRESDKVSICNFIKTVEKTESVNGQEAKNYEFITDPKDTIYLDRLFSILSYDPYTVNETALGNFTTIIKSFVECGDVQADFLKYVFSREDILKRLSEHIVSQAGQHAVSLLLNLPKYLYYRSKYWISQFLKHRQALFTNFYSKLLASDNIEEIEGIVELFNYLIKENKRIWDATYFINKIVICEENTKKLLEKIISCDVLFI